MIQRIKNLENIAIQYLLEKWVYVFLIAFTTIAFIFIQQVGIKAESGDWTFYYIKWYQELKITGWRGLDVFGGDYPNGFNALLSFLTYLPVSPLTAFKYLIITFQFISAIASGLIVYSLGKNKFHFALAYSLILLLPSFILNTAIWGQVDSIWVSLVLVAIYFILKDKYILGFLFIGFALSAKQTAIMAIPVLLLLYVRNNKVSIFHFFNIIIGYIIACLPTLIAGDNLKDIFASYSSYGSGITGTVVANFTNVYTLLTPDPTWATWVSSDLFTDVGKWICVFVIGVVLIYMCYNKADVSGSNLILSVIMFVVVFCNFLPGVHDRYMILADILSVVYVMITKNVKQLWIPVYINFVSVYNIINYLHGVSDAVSNTRIVIAQIISIAYLLTSLYFMYYTIKKLCFEQKENKSI